MMVQWWSCVLGLLFMPSRVILNKWTASQSPPSTSFVRINSSAEISCSTSLSKPLGLNLKRRFLNSDDIVYLALEEGRITKTTPRAEFAGRIHVSAGPKVNQGHSFTLQLSWLKEGDTDLYYCSWTYYEDDTSSSGDLSSNGTVIIVGETAEACESMVTDLVIVCLTAAIVSANVILAIGALILKCTRFKKIFTPDEDVKSSSNRCQLVAPEQPVQHCPYLITAVSPRASEASCRVAAGLMTV